MSNKLRVVSLILDDSPFFKELTIKERENLILELFQTYPELYQQTSSDMETGYEASWLTEQKSA